MSDTRGGDRGATVPRATRTRRNGYDSEDAFQKAAAAFFNAALPHDCWWCHVPNAGKRNLIEGARLKKMGMKAGAPDCLFIYHGRAHWIELKTRYGSLQESQVATIPAITAAGSPVVVARTLAEIVSALEAWGIPISPVNKALADRVDLSHTSKSASTAPRTPKTPKTDLPQRMSSAHFKAVMGLSGDGTTKNETASWRTKLSAARRTRFRANSNPNA